MSVPREGQPRLRIIGGRKPGRACQASAETRGSAAHVAYGALPGPTVFPVALPGLPARAPRNPSSVRACFRELRSALNEGWEIVQPIFARPLWSSTDDSATAFNFVLRRDSATRLVTVPEGRTVQRFIRDKKLLVDYRK